MSSAAAPDAQPYNPLAITAWTILSALVAFGVFLLFVFNQPLTETGRWIWDVLRYLAQPII